MSDVHHPYWRGQRVVIGTMHGKEAVIAPILGVLGLQVAVARGLDTDQFGTFTRDIARKGDQYDTVRAKARAALAQSGAPIAIASEGSFGPHPSVPWLPANLEVVLLLDSRTGREYIGKSLTTRTAQAHAIIRSLEEATVFAERNGFPQHALVIRENAHDDATVLAKGVQTLDDLAHAVARGLTTSTELLLETDLRAHLNPTRMDTIASATKDLLRLLTAYCPQCRVPGFDVIEYQPGLPCADCHQPTRQTRTETLACHGCGHTVTRAPENTSAFADPGRCDHCNP